MPLSEHDARWKKLHLPETKEEAQRLLLMADMHGKYNHLLGTVHTDMHGKYNHLVGTVHTDEASEIIYFIVYSHQSKAISVALWFV